MNVKDLSAQDRATLLTTLRQFRANYGEEPEDDYSNRDVIEAALENGEGELDDVNTQVLLVAIVDVLPEDEESTRLFQLLGDME